MAAVAVLGDKNPDRQS